MMARGSMPGSRHKGKHCMAQRNNNDKSLESWIWDATCSIRGAKDVPKYKDCILLLIFTNTACTMRGMPSARSALRSQDRAGRRAFWMHWARRIWRC
jgi:hypothetical protein